MGSQKSCLWPPRQIKDLDIFFEAIACCSSQKGCPWARKFSEKSSLGMLRSRPGASSKLGNKQCCRSAFRRPAELICWCYKCANGVRRGIDHGSLRSARLYTTRKFRPAHGVLEGPRGCCADRLGTTLRGRLAYRYTNQTLARLAGNPPFSTGFGSRNQAAMASRCFGVNPPKAMFGRS